MGKLTSRLFNMAIYGLGLFLVGTFQIHPVCGAAEGPVRMYLSAKTAAPGDKLEVFYETSLLGELHRLQWGEFDRGEQGEWVTKYDLKNGHYPRFHEHRPNVPRELVRPRIKSGPEYVKIPTKLEPGIYRVSKEVRVGEGATWFPVEACVRVISPP